MPEIPPGQHTKRAEAVAIHCMDLRFQPLLDTYLRDRFGDGNVDRIAVGGGVRELVRSPEDSFVLGQLRTSVQLHHPPRVVLLQHEDCGAYGGSKAFAGDEVTEQAEELGRAETVVRSAFPDVHVEKHVATCAGEIRPV